MPFNGVTTARPVQDRAGLNGSTPQNARDPHEKWSEKLAHKFLASAGTRAVRDRHPGGAGLQRLIAALPICLVNAVAVIGQLSWAREHLAGWGLAGQLLFAGSLESIALFLSYFAYLAEKSNDSALRLKLISYLLGFLVGALNYSNHAIRWHPTTVAVVVGCMSSLSPWLWSVYSRRVSRAVLAANGLIEQHALRIGMTRVIWHPIRSFQVMREATWSGQTKIAKVIATYESVSKDKKRTVTAT